MAERETWNCAQCRRRRAIEITRKEWRSEPFWLRDGAHAYYLATLVGEMDRGWVENRPPAQTQKAAEEISGFASLLQDNRIRSARIRACPSGKAFGVKVNRAAARAVRPELRFPVYGRLRGRYRDGWRSSHTIASGASANFRKEVIQPQVLLRLPCYDFTPIMSHTLGACLLAVSLATSSTAHFRDVTGGVYKARERIHGVDLIRHY